MIQLLFFHTKISFISARSMLGADELLKKKIAVSMLGDELPYINIIYI